MLKANKKSAAAGRGDPAGSGYPDRLCPESLSGEVDGDILGPRFETGGKMTGMQWGRLQVDVNCRLRRGAWYRVKAFASLNAVLDVNRQLLAVPHYLIEVVSAPPRRWSVVPRPQNARVLPPNWGAAYGVCPSCRERAALRGRPRTMECRRCRGQFEIAWDEAYLAG
jgi:hypothetical protein